MNHDPKLVPTAKKIESNKTLHGQTLSDPYAWLRDANWQQVMQNPEQLCSEIRAYLEAENTYTEECMRDTQVLQDTLFEEMKGRIKEDDQSVPAQDNEYCYFSQYRHGDQYPSYWRYPTSKPTQKECLLDCNMLAAKTDYFDIGACEHSPDHRYFAYCVDILGSEFYTLRILDLTTKTLLTDTIERVQGNFVWAMDSQTIFYTTLDDNHRPDRVLRHSIDQPEQTDELVYQENDAGFFVGLDNTESRKYIVINVHDHATSEVHLVDAYQPHQAARLVSARESGIEYSVSDHQGQLIIHTNANGHEDFKLMHCSLNATQRSEWNDYLLPDAGTLLEGIYLLENFLIRQERKEGLPRIVIAGIDDQATLGKEYVIDFQETAYELDVIAGYEYDTSNLRFRYTSMTTPTQIYDFDLVTQKRNLRKQQEVPSGHTIQDFVTERIDALAEDGERIPISLLYHKNTVLSQHTPLVLYGYGAYGHSMPASFSTTRLSLVTRGFVYAIAHIRGGMEKGYRWYRQGKLKHKRNTFSDFIACAEHLIKNHYTGANQISIHGGSAGGMLIGAVLNMRPDLFRAVCADVPFVDVVNTMSDDTLPLTPPEWPEWGNPISSAEDFEYILSYSPYENIKTQDYPHILVTAGLTDPRVTYWEPAKWVARLRENKTDNNILLLKTNMSAGHAGLSGRYESLKETAFIYAFLLRSYEHEPLARLVQR